MNPRAKLIFLPHYLVLSHKLSGHFFPRALLMEAFVIQSVYNVGLTWHRFAMGKENHIL